MRTWMMNKENDEWGHDFDKNVCKICGISEYYYLMYKCWKEKVITCNEFIIKNIIK